MASRKTVVLILGLLMALMLMGCNADIKKGHPAKGQTSVHSDTISSSGDKLISAEENAAKRSQFPLAEKTKSRPEPTQMPESVQPEAAALEKVDQQAVKDMESKQVINNDTGAVKSRVRLVVTRDFGKSLISDGWVPMDKPITALDLTTGNLKTETAYGGVFITSINGIASGYTGKAAWNKEKVDWFLYYNGKISPAGANNITVKAGDVIWWDYHNWGGEQIPLPEIPPGR